MLRAAAAGHDWGTRPARPVKDVASGRQAPTLCAREMTPANTRKQHWGQLRMPCLAFPGWRGHTLKQKPYAHLLSLPHLGPAGHLPGSEGQELLHCGPLEEAKAGQIRGHAQQQGLLVAMVLEYGNSCELHQHQGASLAALPGCSGAEVQTKGQAITGWLYTTGFNLPTLRLQMWATAG